MMRQFLVTVTSLLFMAVVLVALPASTVAADVVLQVALVERPEHRSTYEALFQRFEEENPGIKVEVISLPGGSLRDERLTVLFAGGQMPDIWGEGGSTATFHVMNWVLDLSPYVKRDEAELDLNDFLPTAWDNVAREGKIIGMPWGTSTSAFAYNRQHLDRAGLAYPPVEWSDTAWDYNTMIRYARQLTRPSGDGPAQVFGFENWLWEDYLLAWAQLFGGDWFDAASYETGVVNEVVINSPQTIEAYDELMRLMYELQVMPAPAGRGWAAQPVHWEPFASGDIATRITSSWAYEMYFDSGLDDWGLAAIPQFPAGRQNLVFNDAWHISRDTKHPEAAWTLLKFLSSQEAMEFFSERTLFGPARVSALNPYVGYVAEKTSMSPADVIEVMVGSQTYGRESPDHVFHGWADFRVIAAEVLGKIWARQVPVAAGLDEAQRRMQAVADEIRRDLSRR